MLKYIFAFIMLAHGLIHFMGFAKAFDKNNVSAITQHISKLAGIGWFITAILFVITVVLFLIKNQYWPVTGFIAAIISQVLIITVWKDARFGTIANCIVLLVAIVGFANVQFAKKVNKEVNTLLAPALKNKTIVSKEMIQQLPAVIQKWLLRSGIVGRGNVQFVRLKQKGEMRTKPGGDWMSFEAVQYFNVNEPQFIWQTTVNMVPLITLAGRDKFVNGQDEMQIKLLSLINVANAGPGEKINSATMIRYLAETTWFPAAAINDYIKWEPIDSLSARAIMTYKAITVSGIFTFNASGDMVAFTADRYYGTGNDARKEKWLVETTGYKDFNGIRIPYKSKVSWQLKTGEFNWANVELTDLDYNLPEQYP
ncbi:MAG TPA: DUF6544 family protein [Ferruginibacter sp.]|nr:DUF6544 family protein [Ferruginibacter sp.]